MNDTLSKINDLEHLLKTGSIPANFGHWLNNYGILDPICASVFTVTRSAGMYALVDKVWCHALAFHLKGKRVLEIMSGVGWLAKGLQAEGIAITPTDEEPLSYAKQGQLVLPIEVLEATAAIQKYPDSEILLVAWPPYSRGEINRACIAWGSTRPIVYIGESEGGCTADGTFFDHFELTQELPGPSQLPGLHDHCWLGYYR